MAEQGEGADQPPEPAKRPRTRRAKDSADANLSNSKVEPLSTDPATAVKAKRSRSNRPFPAGPFEEALEFAKQIYDFASGQPVRRFTLFDHLQRTPDSSTSRQLITNASKYGLLKGNYASEQLELTPEGRKVCDDSTTPREAARIRAKLAVLDITPFNALFERFVNSKLPARAALIDSLKEVGVDADHLEEGVDTLIVNLKAVGLLQNLSGADRVVPLDHLLDSLPGAVSTVRTSSASVALQGGQNLITQEQASFESTCFYITPIGSEESDARKHAKPFLRKYCRPRH